MTPTVRGARPSDRARLTEIQETALSDPTPALLGAALDGPLLGLVRCDDDGRPVGYAIAVTAEDRAYVPELTVDPLLQRRGHGSALLAAACRRLGEKGVSLVRLTARADDSQARTFYERQGFEAVERAPDHYGNGVDGIVYERDIHPPE